MRGAIQISRVSCPFAPLPGVSGEGARRAALFQTVKPNDRSSQRLCKLDDLEVANPSRTRLDASDRESVDVPSLPLASRRKLLLRQAVVIANSPNLFANHIFSLGHLCAYEHSTVADSCCVVCARMRNNVLDGAARQTNSAGRTSGLTVRT